jgi:nucleotide-binding universal stress UspA family protein
MRHPIIAALAHDDEAREAVALAVNLARADGAPLILAGVYVAAPGPGSKGYTDAVRPEVEAELQAAARGVPEDVSCTVRVIGSSSVVRGLHELAEETEAALLVLGPSHVTGVVRAMAGDVTLGAVHTAPCPVAVAPAGFATGERPLRTIGVGYSDAPEARDALEAATELAQRNGGDVRIIHVLGDPIAAGPFLAGDAAVSDTERLREQAEAWLEEARAVVGGRVAVDTQILHGDPAAQLVDAARDLDLLVVGSRGFGPLRRVLLGSVTAGLVHEAPCPVLVLPRGAHVYLDAGAPA